MIADFVVILVLFLCIFLGYKKGLIKVAVRILSFVLSLIIALVLYTPVSNYIIDNTEVVPSLKNNIYGALYHGKEEEENKAESSNFVQSMEKYISDYTDSVQASTSEAISEQLAIIVVRIGTWIGLFLVSKIVLLLLGLLSDAIAEIPIIKQFNKAGGTIYGILEGFMIVYAALTVFSMVSPMIGENGVSREIQNSHLCKAMYENNIILKMIL